MQITAGRGRRARWVAVVALGLVGSTLALGAAPALAADSPSPEVPSGAPAAWGTSAIATSIGSSTDAHTCAITSDATPNVKCWGNNVDGRLGVGDTTARTWPTRVTLLGAGSVPEADQTNGPTIAVAWGHSCVIYDNATTSVTGGVQCWGDNDNRELGDGSTTDRLTPVIVPGLTGVVAITAGGSSRTTGYTCAVLADGTARCWGYNVNGETGNGTTTSPVASPAVVKLAGGANLTGVVGIAAGQKTTCSVVSSGGNRTAWCWGLGNQGRLGDNNVNTHTAGTGAVAVVGPNNTAALTAVRSITVGWDHTCYSNGSGAGGTAYCWGIGGVGQVGNNGTANYGTPTPVTTTLLGTSVTAIAAGYTHTCATTSTGTAYCWGENDNGRLAQGTGLPNNNQLVPSQVVAQGDDLHRSTLTTASSAAYGSLASGALQSCVRTTSGEALCWGGNANGQLGEGSTGTDRWSPRYVNGTATGRWTVAAVGVSKGYNGNGTGNHTCVVTDTNTDLGGTTDTTAGVKCWGYGADGGQIGDGSNTNRFQPTEVALSSRGYLGGSLPIPRKSQALGSSLAVADASGCVIVDAAPSASSPGVTGGVQCWGSGDEGNLGDGTLTAGITSRVVQTPTGDGMLADVVSIDAASYSYNFYTSVCAVTAAGAVYCWGFEDSGELGNGAGITGNQSRPTQTIATGATSVSVGTESSCAVMADGTARCWGHDVAFGALGDGLSTDHTAVSPVTVTGLTGVKSISSGEYSACALTTAGAVRCWGRDNFGQLGDDATLANKSTSVAVSGLGSGVAAISVGGSTACATLTDGSARCWGRNAQYQAGDGTTTTRPTPVTVLDVADKAGGAPLAGLSTNTFGSISTGTNSSCARSATGQLGCWGRDAGFGDLGSDTRDGTTETYVNCGQETVGISAATTCTATVVDRATWRATAPLGTVALTATNSGIVSGSPCTLVKINASASRCTATVSKAAIGSFTVSGTYTPVSSPSHSASTSAASNSVLVVATRNTTSTAVTCTPNPLAPGATTTCTALVTDTAGSGQYDTAGTVTFSAAAIGATTPTAAPTSCSITGGNATSSSCSVTLTSAAGGASVITGTYLPSTLGETTKVHGASSGTANVTWKLDQTISFTQPPTPVFLGSSYATLTATATSGLTVTFTSATPAVCTVTGTTVTYNAAGTCTINANQAGDATYSAAPQVQRSVGVSAKTDQTTTFTSTPPATPAVAGAYLLSATATSGLTVTFTSATPAVCTVSGTSTSFIRAGTCTINANQAGDGTYNAAPQVQQTMTVTVQAPDLALSVDAGANVSAVLNSSGLLTCSSPDSGPTKGALTTGTTTSCARTYRSNAGSANAAPGGTDTFTYRLFDLNGVPSAPATVTITIRNPDLSLVKSHTGRFNPGTGTGTYTLTVANTATATANGTKTIVDTLPAGTAFRSYDAGTSGFACTGTPGSSTTVTCTRTSAIAPSTTGSLTITVDVDEVAVSPGSNVAVLTSGYELAATAADNTAVDATAFNHRPVAQASAPVTDIDAPVVLVLSATDPDGDPLTYNIISAPVHGSLSGTGASRQYSPDAGFQGLDPFTFQVVDDGLLTSMVVTVQVHVGVSALVGRVTSTEGGAGLSGVEVRLVDNRIPSALDPALIATATTDATGHYDFAPQFPTLGAVPFGDYVLRFVDPTNDHISEWYADAPSRATATNTTLGTASSKVTRDAALVPGGRIQGTLRSTGGANPTIAGLQVRLYRIGAGGSTAKTTLANGQYLFELLPAGQYQLWYRDVSSGTWVSEWYEDKPSQATATAVPLTVGQQRIIDASITPIVPVPPPVEATITGTVRTAASGNAPVAGIQVRLYAAPYTTSTATTTDANGQYTFADRPAGSYKLWFRNPVSGGLASEYWTDRPDLASADVITLGTSTFVADALLTPPTPAAAATGIVTGRVTELDGTTPVAGIQVRLYRSGEAAGSTATTTDADGTYTFVGRAPGQYQVWFRDLASRWFSEWNLNRSTQATADPITVGGATTTVVVDASLAAR